MFSFLMFKISSVKCFQITVTLQKQPVCASFLSVPESVCFLIVSKAKQWSASFHTPPSLPSLERQFPEPKPGNFASVSWAEKQSGL